MTAASPSNQFQTTDLNLAAFLIHEGLSSEKFRKGDSTKGRPIGGWRFREQDSTRVQELVMQYNEDESHVNPKTFHQTLARVRGEMYDFLGIKKRKD